MFLLDSHNHNTSGLHDPNGKAVLLKFSIVSSLNNYIKYIFESSSNNSLETQYSPQYICIEITEETRNEVLKKIQGKRKSLYKKTITPSNLQKF